VVDEDGSLKTWPHRHGVDGFFAARLRRSTQESTGWARDGRKVDH
jgi:hypothetical protein